MATINQPAAVQLHDVHQQFGRKRVLRGVDLFVARGTSAVLTGANGAGKTTLLRVVATLLRPSSGTGSVCGFPLGEGARIREHIAYVSSRGTLYDDLTAVENLQFTARLMGAPATETRIDELLESAGLLAARDQRIRTFSTGMRRRLSLSALRLRPLDLVLMDEPYSGLDTEGMTMVDRMIDEFLTAGAAVIVATHVAGDATRRAAASYRIQGGRLVLAEDAS